MNFLLPPTPLLFLLVTFLRLFPYFHFPTHYMHHNIPFRILYFSFFLRLNPSSFPSYFPHPLSVLFIALLRHIPPSLVFLSLSSFPSFLSSRLTNFHSPTPHAIYFLINSSASTSNPLRLMAPLFVPILFQFFLFIFLSVPFIPLSRVLF
jgi:hypothetical protein